MNRFEAIKEAVEARDSFLKEHPELQVFQNEINTVLSGAISQHNRIVLLREMIVDKIQELKELLR